MNIMIRVLSALFLYSILMASLHLHSAACYNNIILPHQRSVHNGRSSILNKSRREFIAFTTMMPSLLVPPLVDQNAYAADDLNLSTTKEVAQYIKKYANQYFLSSVIESDYNFLYRGQLVDKNSCGIIIKDEPFDLLDVDTYGSIEAASYFQSLEVQMNANGLSIRPSNSHMGTTCPLEAAKWGTAVSIWPIGEQFGSVQFAWMEEGGLFWPIPSSTLSKPRTIAHSDGTHKSDGLSDALRGDAWEIMFRSDNGFLAVPATFDDELKQILRQKQI